MAFLQNEINRGHEPLARTFGTPINRGHESSREKSIGDTNLWHTNQSGTRIFTRRFSKRLCFSVRGKSIGDTNLWHTNQSGTQNQSGTRIFTRRFSKRLCFSVRGDEKIQCLLMARDSAADGRAER